MKKILSKCKKNNAKLKIKVLVAMSGGVDSSVAAKLLIDQGYDVAGIFLHFWKNPPNPLYQGGTAQPNPANTTYQDNDFENKCCSTEALMDARRVCNKIGIPLYTLNFSNIFKKQIVDNFLNEYKAGRTPNPCVRCNKLVKIGYLIKQARKLGFDYVASGHYVRLWRKFPIPNSQFSKNTNKKNICKLYKAKDKNKDQSYFLYTFNQDELNHLLFPLGNYIKPQIRLLAKKFELPVAEKKESQEICFIPEKSHNEFLKQYLKLKPGPIIPLTPFIKGKDKQIGEHQGLPLYTIGQRKGVDIGGIGPFYVVKADYKTNTLFVVNDNNDPALFSDQLIVKNVNWLSNQTPKLPLICQAVIRYHHSAMKCVVSNSPNPLYQRGTTQLNYSPPPYQGEYADFKNNLLVKFTQPQRAITPGQSIVFYKKNEVLGGGVIK